VVAPPGRHADRRRAPGVAGSTSMTAVAPPSQESTPSPDASRPVAVVDIDGVVADVRHRLHLIEAPTKDWEGFFAAATKDPPLPEGLALVLALKHDHDVVWLTGRPEHTRADTVTWLAQHGDDDRRPARHGKRDVVRELSTRRRIAIIIDDDPSVVRHLAEAGFQVRLAEWLPHSSTLRSAQERLGRT
jgi:hypothetical protein